MAIRVALHHHTSYRFDRAVSVSPHVIRLRPASHTRTPIHAYSLKIEPAQHFINWMQDPFGNFQARLVFPEKVRELSLTVDLVAEMTVINPFSISSSKATPRSTRFPTNPRCAGSWRPIWRRRKTARYC
jgi:transglutaminase-like putative cysteine protease